jgi:GNAT superfamily N-acetyltransferase
LSEKLAIRLATASDVETIHRLLQHLADSTGLRHKFLSRPQDILKFGFSDEPRFEALLAEQGDVVVGLCLFFYNFSSWRGELGVYIQDLVVDSDVRAAGIGRLLVLSTRKSDCRSPPTKVFSQRMRAIL